MASRSAMELFTKDAAAKIAPLNIIMGTSGAMITLTTGDQIVSVPKLEKITGNVARFAAREVENSAKNSLLKNFGFNVCNLD